MEEGLVIIVQFRKRGPGAVGFHKGIADQVGAQFFHILCKQGFCLCGSVLHNEAHTFGGAGFGAVQGFCQGTDPAFADAAPIHAQRIVIVGMQTQPSAGLVKSTGNPCGGQVQDAFSGFKNFSDCFF